MNDPIITLVHGTWGRLKIPFFWRPLWFEEGSQFVNQLRSELNSYSINADIRAFKWTGSNSIIHRADASFSLARALDRQKEENPHVLQIVIGHSHGGTVCLLSLKDLSRDAKPILVTLATPFMEIVNSEFVPSAQAIKKLATKEALQPTITLIAIAIAATVTRSGDLPDVNSSVYNLVSFAGLWCARLLPHFLGTVKTSQGPDDLAWLRHDRLTPADFERLTKGGATIEAPRDILVIRAIDDEAGLALTAGAIGARLSSMTVTASARALRTLNWVGVSLLILLVVPLLSQFQIFDDEILKRVSDYLYIALRSPYFSYPAAGIFLTFCLMPFAACLLKSVYGRELLIGGYFCDIKSGSAPDAPSGVTMITLPSAPAGGLRHGIYHNERVAPAVAKFISEHMSEHMPPNDSPWRTTKPPN